MAQWFLHASLLGALKAGAGGCDWLFVDAPYSLCCFSGLAYVASMVVSMAWTKLIHGVSMAWTMLCFCGLNFAFTHACFYDTSMGGHYTWYLVTCNEISPKTFV
jgi:hypothetical protein